MSGNEKNANRTRRGYVPPVPDLLIDPVKPRNSEAPVSADRAESILSRYVRVPVSVDRIVDGYAFSRYEFALPDNVSVNRLRLHISDLEHSFGGGIRLDTENNAIEVEKKQVTHIGLKSCLRAPLISKNRAYGAFPIGKSAGGIDITGDFDRMPNIIAAGKTGSGIGAFINSLIVGMMYKYSPDDLRFVLVDLSRTQFSVYDGMPHLYTDVVSDIATLVDTLGKLKEEAERRAALFAKYGVSRLAAYNILPEVVLGKREKLCRIVIVIDEFADCGTDPAFKHDVETSIEAIASRAKTVGIHLVIATKKPTFSVLSHPVRAAVPSRIAFKLPQSADSRVVIKTDGAEKLAGNGDMLVNETDSGILTRVQGAYITADEICAVVKFLKNDCKSAVGAVGNEVREKQRSNVSSAYRPQSSDEDPIITEFIEYIKSHEGASISDIAKALSIGFIRAARAYDLLISRGDISYVFGKNTEPEKPVPPYRTAERCDRSSRDRLIRTARQSVAAPEEEPCVIAETPVSEPVEDIAPEDESTPVEENTLDAAIPPEEERSDDIATGELEVAPEPAIMQEVDNASETNESAVIDEIVDEITGEITGEEAVYDEEAVEDTDYDAESAALDALINSFAADDEIAAEPEEMTEDAEAVEVSVEPYVEAEEQALERESVDGAESAIEEKKSDNETWHIEERDVEERDWRDAPERRSDYFSVTTSDDDFM